MKKIINKQRFSLLILGMMLVSLLIAMTPAQATITTTHTELFSDETTNSNPSADWYTYAERNFAYANVNNSDEFLINDSSSPPAAGYANFTFDTLPTAHSNYEAIHYTDFYYSFKYNNNIAGATAAKHNHSGVKLALVGNSATICTVYVYGLNETVTNLKNRILITNYSGAVKVNRTCKYGFEYGVAYSPDYDANTITVTLYNVTAGGTVLNTTTMTLQSQTNLASLKIQNYPASRRVYIYIDDMSLTEDVPNYTSFDSTTQLIVITAVPVLLIVAILSLAISGNLTTPEGMVSLLVVLLLCFVTIAFIFS